MVQNSFFDQIQGGNEEVLVKKSSVDHFHEERNYHEEIKMFYEISGATEIIRCCTRLLKGSNVNTDELIFSSSPVNVLFTPEIYFCFC